MIQDFAKAFTESWEKEFPGSKNKCILECIYFKEHGKYPSQWAFLRLTSLSNSSIIEVLKDVLYTTLLITPSIIILIILLFVL